MRILVIHPHLNVVGGSEVLTRIFVYEAERQGHEVLVLTSARREEFFPETRHVKFKLFRRSSVEGSARRAAKTRFTDILETIAETLEGWEPDATLVLIQEPVYAVAVKLVEPRARVASYLHFPFEDEVTRENLQTFLGMYRFPNMYFEFFKVVDVRIANSWYTATVLKEKLGFDAVVVHPAIEWVYFEEEVDPREPREPTIVTIGRFVPQKAFEKIIEVFEKMVKPKVPEARLVIKGVADQRHLEYRDKILALADKAKDVEVIDEVWPPEKIAALLREASVYVHARLGEHFGMAPVEAMSQGTIPVIPRVSGLGELITEGREGFTFTTFEEMGKLLVKLLRMPRDEAARYRAAAIKAAWHFNPARFTREVVACLKLAKAFEKPWDQYIPV